MKRIILFMICVLIFSCSLSAEMPTIIGYAEFNNKPYRDTIYDWLIAKSSNCINRLVIEKEDYTIVPPTASAYYTLKLQMHYPLAKLSERTEAKEKIKSVKSNSKTTKMKIGIYGSHNDEPFPKPDAINEWILK